MAEKKPRPGGLSEQQYDVLSQILYNGLGGGVVPPQVGEQLAGQLGIVRPMPEPERGPEMAPIPQQAEQFFPASFLQNPNTRSLISNALQQSGVEFPEPPQPAPRPRPFAGLPGIRPDLIELLPYQFRQFF